MRLVSWGTRASASSSQERLASACTTPPRREAAEVRSGMIGELVDDGLEVSQVEPYRFAVAAEHRPEGIGSCVAGHESVISKTRLSGADV